MIDRVRRSLRATELLLRKGEPGIAASHAYYAMFYAAEAMLLSRNLSFSKHSGVMAASGREFAKTGTVPFEFHRWLMDAFDARNVGDYDIHRDLTGEQAAEHLRRATILIEAAAEFLGRQE